VARRKLKRGITFANNYRKFTSRKPSRVPDLNLPGQFTSGFLTRSIGQAAKPSITMPDGSGTNVTFILSTAKWVPPAEKPGCRRLK
jgi:hypothetical protein